MHTLQAMPTRRPSAFFVAGWRPIKKEITRLVCEQAHTSRVISFFAWLVAMRGCSQRESNPQLALRRRLLYPFNYENFFPVILPGN